MHAISWKKSASRMLINLLKITPIQDCGTWTVCVIKRARALSLFVSMRFLQHALNYVMSPAKCSIYHRPFSKQNANMAELTLWPTIWASVEIENITWLLGNMNFISNVEQDISRVCEANEWDILLSTRNKFHISKHPCNIRFISETFTKNLNFYCKQSR